MWSNASVAVWLWAASLGGQQIESMLNTFGGRAPRGAAAVRDLHVRDVNSLANYWSRPGAWRGGNRATLDRSYAYLESLRPFAGGNAALAIALAGAYRQLASAQEPYARDGALAAYAASALLYSRWVGSQPGLRDDLVWVAGRVNGLGGTLPFLAAVPFGGPPRVPQGLDAVRAQAIPQAVPPPPERWRWPSGVQAPPALRERFEGAAVAVRTAHLTVQPIRESVASLGQSLHPDTLGDLAKMESRMEMAVEQIRAGQFEEAGESLQIAEALARRVGKQFGQ
ncbi:MAG: hypothetical protein K2Q23_04330 [Bryobacteraceae bacterium]|nr:hypothetical protein [Bryobacteraceae bacterium]